ncbi:MAG: hypothetical protein OEU36_24210 [Gammaproteobacteria bacterium]|nr:hypothetical protein [Gammaproteobacteria bacterium]
MIKHNERKTKTYRIEKHVEALVQDAEAKPQRRDDILREIEQNHNRVKQILAELERSASTVERWANRSNSPFIGRQGRAK